MNATTDQIGVEVIADAIHAMGDHRLEVMVKAGKLMTRELDGHPLNVLPDRFDDDVTIWGFVSGGNATHLDTGDAAGRARVAFVAHRDGATATVLTVDGKVTRPDESPYGVVTDAVRAAFTTGG